MKKVLNMSEWNNKCNFNVIKLLFNIAVDKFSSTKIKHNNFILYCNTNYANKICLKLWRVVQITRVLSKKFTDLYSCYYCIIKSQILLLYSYTRYGSSENIWKLSKGVFIIQLYFEEWLKYDTHFVKLIPRAMVFYAVKILLGY